MKLVLATLLLGCAALLSAAEDIIYRNDFNTADALRGWNRGFDMKLQPSGGIDGSGCVLFTNAKPDDSNFASFPLDVEKLKGRAVMVEGWMKARDVGKPKLSYLGPKLMLAITSRDGVKSHPDQPKEIGTYDWKKFTVFARIPRSATQVNLCLGLQGCTGKLWVDDVKVTLLPAPALPQGGLSGQLTPGKETKFRGVMSGADLSPAAFKELREVWNANLIRYQIKRERGDDHTTPEGFRKIIERGMRELDEILPAARQNNIQLLIDMHVGPGTSLNELLSNQLSWDPAMQQLLIDAWRDIAEKYKDEPMIWGYDLLNEPREENYVYTPNGGLDWNRLAEKIAKAIREVDPKTPIIVESAQWGSAAGFENLMPINVPNVIYSFHIYNPGEYTHQGVYNRPENVVYPGMIAGKQWNKETLRKEMAPVMEFQKKYNVPIYVGEFGVVRWAPNAEAWLDDVISIFEENGWDWTYHAFREYHGWDAELGTDKADTRKIKDTPRREVLRKYMKNNK